MKAFLHRAFCRCFSMIRQRQADGRYTVSCSRCGYQTDLIARSANERKQMAQQYPTKARQTHAANVIQIRKRAK